MLTLLTDWHVAVKENNVTGQQRSTKAESMYTMLKESAEKSFQTTQNIREEFIFKSYIVAETEDRLNEIIEHIKINKRKRIELYAVLGKELAYMKYRTMERNRCASCICRNNIYYVINCKVCIKKNDIKSFYDRVSNITQYSRDYITFLIRLSGMCLFYPKLLHATVSIDDFKKHAKYVENRMKQDRHFWRIR